jgi:hypothetical protein
MLLSRVIMGANSAGIYGAQLYREDDEPRYRRAFSICIAVLTLGTVTAIVRKIDEVRIRRRNGGRVETESTVEEAEVYDELKPVASSDAAHQPTLRV